MGMHHFDVSCFYDDIFHHHFFKGKSTKKWPFSIAMLVYQTVSSLQVLVVHFYTKGRAWNDGEPMVNLGWSLNSRVSCLFHWKKHVTSALAPRLKLRVPTLDNLPGTFYKHLKLIQNVCIYIHIKIWRFPETGVLPNHSCMDGISLNKPSIWGTPILGNLHTVDACETTGLSLPTITKHSPPPPLIRNTWGRF